MATKKVGKIIHYYTDIQVGIFKLTAGLKVGDKIKIKGKSTEFKQTVDSMELDRKEVKTGKKGQEVGIKVSERVREGDGVWLV